MYLVTALLVRAGPEGPDRRAAVELADRLRSYRSGASPRDGGPAHLYATARSLRAVAATLFMECPDALHAELAALDFLLGVLTAGPGTGGWHLVALGRPDPRRFPDRKGQGPTCHGTTPPCP
ncbi:MULTISPECIES: hypothetical protein [unclassified Streptomyces]|uniref:hypothetical protein n=1 Tax=unclassified Streptomyces TaxID=2593676 RepID=UPI00093C2066|nr:hypothetical protein [Streptomyces sp. TSRI0281]OKI47632.1 hypothetical protein A6A29_00620 [Streptomyces sp. TSRI0281]